MTKDYGEIECPGCGLFFTKTHPSQKYCPSCRADRGRTKKEIEKNIIKNRQKYKQRSEPTAYPCTCKNCGMEFPGTSEFQSFCSKACRDEYHILTATCPICGKNLYGIGIIIDADQRQPVYCSDGCREKAAWQRAKIRGDIHTCEYCGKEFLRNGKARFCSQDCFIRARKEGTLFQGVEKPEPVKITCKCRVCGKTFEQNQSSFQKNLCSPECVNKANQIRKQKEKQRKQQQYIQENGLCSICRTPYPDCERMRTNFRLSPKGSVFQDGKVIKCPKYTGAKTG